MKKLLLFSLITTIAISAHSQKTGFWENQHLTGQQAKIIPTGGSPRISVSLLGSLPIGDLAAQTVELSSLQMAVFAPGTAEQLFEKMGGPLIIGDPSGQNVQAFARSCRRIR